MPPEPELTPEQEDEITKLVAQGYTREDAITIVLAASEANDVIDEA